MGERSLSGNRIQISRDVLVLLAVYRDGMTSSQLSTELTSRGYDSTIEETDIALSTLESAGILSQDQDTKADRIASDQVWGHRWGAAAQRFHWSTRYPNGLGSEPGTVPVFQRYPDAPLVKLPAPRPLPSVPFADVLAGRRTTREFAGNPLSLDMVSRLVYYVHFPHHLVESPPYGWLPRRAWANGGARSELELYVLARNVDCLERGLYHYQADGHQLELIKGDLSDDYLRNMTYGQEMCVEAPVTVFVTAVPRRSAAKYGTARALRVIYADSGCLLQTFGMVATALGLGAYTTAAFCDEDAEHALGLDGIRETPLLMLGAGVPASQRIAEQIMDCSAEVPFPGELFEDVQAQ
jgi:SagB-type dehydrogenase family enzyme